MQLVSLPQLFLGSVPRSSGYSRQGMAPPLSRLRGAVGLVRLFSSLFAPLNVQHRGTFPCRARSPGQVLQRRAVHLGTAGSRWHLCSVPALPWGSGSHLNPFPAAWVPAEALPCPQPCAGLAVNSGLRARRCAGQPSAPPPSFAAAWLLSRGAPSSSPPPAAGGRSPNAFIPYVHAVNPLLPVPVPRSPAFPCRLVRSALPPSCCRTD